MNKRKRKITVLFVVVAACMLMASFSLPAQTSKSFFYGNWQFKEALIEDYDAQGNLLATYNFSIETSFNNALHDAGTLMDAGIYENAWSIISRTDDAAHWDGKKGNSFELEAPNILRFFDDGIEYFSGNYSISNYNTIVIEYQVFIAPKGDIIYRKIRETLYNPYKENN